MKTLTLIKRPYGSLARTLERAYVVRTASGSDVQVLISNTCMRVGPAGARVDLVRIGVLARLLGAFWNMEFREGDNRLLAIGIRKIVSITIDFGTGPEVLQDRSRMGKTICCSKSTHLVLHSLRDVGTLEYSDAVSEYQALLYFVYMMNYENTLGS